MNDLSTEQTVAMDHLTIERVDLPPAKADTRPFWERPAYPEPLQPHLDDGSSLNTYLVLDATLRKQAKGAFDLDMLAPDIPARSLFQGEAEQDPTAPWLIDLTRQSRPRDAFLQDFFATQWGKGTGIFLRTAAPEPAVHAHLRGFTKVRKAADSDDFVFFRFWDPVTALVYFDGVRARPDRIDRMLRTRDGLPISLVVEDDETTGYLFKPSDGGTPAKSVLAFDAADHAIFDRIALRALSRDLTNWLKTSYATQMDPLRPAQHAALARHIVRTGLSFGFRLKDEYAYLAHMMMHGGGWCAGTGIFPACDAVLFRPDGQRHRALKQAFPADWAASHLGLIAPHRVQLRATALAASGAPYLGTQQLADLIETVFGHRTGPIWQLFDKVSSDFNRAQVGPDDQTAVGLLSIFFGYRFYDDPTRPWTPGIDEPAVPISDICDAAWRSLQSEAI